MHFYDESIIARLNPYCTGEEIHYVGLGRWDFQLSFGDILRIKAEYKVLFSINGDQHAWESGPCNVPVWLLIGEVPTGFTLDSSEALRLTFKSGNSVVFFTEESPYECCLVEFSRNGEPSGLEVF